MKSREIETQRVVLQADPHFDQAEAVRAEEENSAASQQEDISEAWYIISVAATKTKVHEQTLRHYERLGLVRPARKPARRSKSDGRSHDIRLYSEKDIQQIIQIRRLIEDFGVNLAGVEVILRMKGSMVQLRDEFEQKLQALQQHYETENGRLKTIIDQLQH